MLFEVLSLFFLCGWRTRPQNSTEKKCYSFRVLCLDCLRESVEFMIVPFEKFEHFDFQLKIIKYV